MKGKIKPKGWENTIILSRSQFKKLYGKGYTKLWKYLRANYIRMQEELKNEDSKADVQGPGRE